MPEIIEAIVTKAVSAPETATVKEKLAVMPAASKRGLTKAEVVSAISTANKIFGTNYKLVGGWADKGYSLHDIDLLYGEDSGKVEDEKHKSSALFIARKTGMVVDIFRPGDLPGYNYVVPPDGDCHFWCVRRMEEVEKRDAEWRIANAKAVSTSKITTIKGVDYDAH